MRVDVAEQADDRLRRRVARRASRGRRGCPWAGSRRRSRGRATGTGGRCARRWPSASASRDHIGARRLADLRHGVDEGDLGGQEGVGGHLDQFGGLQVGRRARGCRFRAAGRRPRAAALPRPTREVTPKTRRSGRQGVLDRVALAQELRVPGQLDLVAGRCHRARAAASSVRAVPTGTVDLPTTRHCDRSGAGPARRRPRARSCRSAAPSAGLRACRRTGSGPRRTRRPRRRRW